jgi:hypothetical protein
MAEAVLKKAVAQRQHDQQLLQALEAIPDRFRPVLQATEPDARKIYQTYLKIFEPVGSPVIRLGTLMKIMAKARQSPRPLHPNYIRRVYQLSVSRGEEGGLTFPGYQVIMTRLAAHAARPQDLELHALQSLTEEGLSEFLGSLLLPDVYEVINKDYLERRQRDV